ncbi:MAG: DEAD/DEAH box helicase [Sphaerochaetaceae bacterium]|nr:DEAD/DEAH box helicase [Sphaerochaetaceae bacterium]
MDTFSSLAPYIQDYIYDNKWQNLTDIQNKAIYEILNTDNNILLASQTASGKTEAAFFPILTDLYYNPSRSISVIYISPLIALINDQFERLFDLLEIEDIPLVRWHGQSLVSPKKKILKNPQGIIQITPESLEALVMREGRNIEFLFSDLRYIVIDEVHCFMNNERGLQVMSLISRIEHLIKRGVRHIGLSATLSSYKQAANYLNLSNNKKCSVCIGKDKSSALNLSIQEYTFYNKGEFETGVLDVEQPILKKIYKMAKGKKSIVFANSRKDVEAITAGLKDIVNKENGSLEVYAHHGSLSRIQRNEAEDGLKTKQEVCVGATVTLELGIDIGELDLIIQQGSSLSVSSFVQRLGRSGRKGQTRKMAFLLKKHDNLFKKDPLFIPIDLIKTIAIIELYVKEKWIEPIAIMKYCYFLLFHQILSTIKSLGALAPSSLARRVLSIQVFKYISIEEFKTLLHSMLESDLLEIMEDNSINLGEKGEILTNFYDFYSVFMANKEMSVKFEDKIIGTIGKEVRLGDRIVLSSIKWKVVDIDTEKLEVIVIKDGVEGIAKWEGDYFVNLDIRIVKKMKEILLSNNTYPYLNHSANSYLEKSRYRFHYLKLQHAIIIKSESNVYTLFPWLGSRELRALSLSLENKGYKTAIDNDLTITIEKTKIECETILISLKEIADETVDPLSFNLSKDLIYNKFKNDRFLPYELAKKQYIDYFCDFESMRNELKLLFKGQRKNTRQFFNTLY